jgi:dihydrofolate reductase
MHIKLIIIAAVSTDGIIGIDDQMPWCIPEDFKHFRSTTMGNILLVGGKTYLTLPEKAFEGREYLVLSKSKLPKRDNVYQFGNLDIILYLLENECVIANKVFIAGGAQVYESLIDRCDEAIITWVKKCYPEGNKRFPIDKLFTNFVETQNTEWLTSKNDLEYKISTYKKLTTKDYIDFYSTVNNFNHI